MDSLFENNILSSQGRMDAPYDTKDDILKPNCVNYGGGFVTDCKLRRMIARATVDKEFSNPDVIMNSSTSTWNDTSPITDISFSDAEPLGFHQVVTPAPCVSSSSSTIPIPPSLFNNDSTNNDNSMSSSVNFLHRACQLFPDSPEVVQSALLDCPQSIRCRRRLARVDGSSTAKKDEGLKNYFSSLMRPTSSQQKDQGQRQKRISKVRESYTLPINLAIKYKANLKVLNVLVNAGTDVLELQDGIEGSTSLCVALREQPRNVELIDLLVGTCPQTATAADRRKNLPLHLACAKGSCLYIVRRLYNVYPEALFQKNFHGDSPLDIASRNTNCPEDVISFLHQETSNQLDEDHL